MTPSRGYRRLALATLLATLLLTVIGGVVRVSGSGLGCGPGGSGFNGWPLCRGDLIPGLDLEMVIEYTHRVVAVAVGFAILFLAALAWKRYRAHRALVAATIAAVVLVGAQGLLGGATVEQNLDEALVAAHLGLAMLLLALLVFIWRASRPGLAGAPEADGGPGFRPLALAACAGIFLTILAGGYMAGTQNYGRPDYQLGDGAHHACGREFPTCNGEFMPFGEARLVDIHLTHRALMYVASALVVGLVVLSLRRRPSPGVVRLARVALGLLVLQLLVGALNVWLEEYELLILLHLTLATLLWGTLVGLTLQLFRVPAVFEARRGGSPAREAIPA